MEVYIDGSSLGNPGPAGAAAILVDDNGEQCGMLSRSLGVLTNNQAELEAARIALKYLAASGQGHVVLCTDSEYVVKVLGGCKVNANFSLVREVRDLLDEVIGSMTLVVKHVPGHAGVKHQELADAAARSSAQRCKENGGKPLIPREKEKTACTFCGEQNKNVLYYVGERRVCDACLDTVVSILPDLLDVGLTEIRRQQ